MAAEGQSAMEQCLEYHRPDADDKEKSAAKSELRDNSSKKKLEIPSAHAGQKRDNNHKVITH